MDLKQQIRHIPDFPKAGILFYDITTLLRNREGFAMTVDMLSSPYVGKGIEVVVGIESRGFILGAAYALEYGMDALEVHEDAIDNGHKVLIVDDVLATGGTASAAAKMVRKLGGDLQGLAFLIELQFLNGRSKLADENVFSVLQY
jgi:adenine phosphoribosyltransferase